jgi:Ca2+-binding EF-hand superfamily protein
MSIPKSLRESFSPEELKEHVELFESFDTDGSGEIDAEELQQLCATMGNTMTLEESKEMINDIDTDGNGLVDISEFLTMMLDIKNSPETIASAASDKRISFKNVAMKQASLARDKKERLLREKEARAVERVAMTEEKQQGALVRAYDMKKRAQMEKMQQNDIAYFYHQELQEKIEVEKNIKIERKAQMLSKKAKIAEMRQVKIMREVEKKAKRKSKITHQKLAESQAKKSQLQEEAERKRQRAEMEREEKRLANFKRAEIERLFSAKDLKLFRDQFEQFDVDGSGSIDAVELGNICASLGETLSDSQLRAMIQEIDSNGNGVIEWEEYLQAMYSKRQEAKRKGSGLLEFFSAKLEQVKEKKENQLVLKEKEAVSRANETEKERVKALQRAAKREAVEKEAIIARNEEMQIKALKEKERIETEMNAEILAKAKNISLKDREAAKRLREIEREKDKEAMLKSKQTKLSQIEKEEKRIALIREKEQHAILTEIEKEKKRQANKRRADLERLFTPSDLRAFREQFDTCDADGSGSIDVEEMGSICRALGEDMTQKQVQALIDEVDANGNGLVEWEEYLEAMYKKRQNARARGAGMLEFASMRASQAREKKEQQAVLKDKTWQKKNAEAEKVRKEAIIKAQRMKEEQKIEIAKHNEAIRLKKIEALDEIEAQKKIEEKEKTRLVQEKAKKALLVQREQEKLAAEEVKKKQKERLKKSKQNMIKKEQLKLQEEQARVEREKLKQKKREENAKRAEIERMFNPRDMKHFKGQFKQYDTEGTGSIPVLALGNIMSALGEELTDNQLGALIRKVDTDESGTIEWNEYLVLMHLKREEARSKGMGLLEYASVRKKEAAAIRKREANQQRIEAAKKVKATAAEILKANKRQMEKVEREKEEKIRQNKEARKKADILQKQVKKDIEKKEKAKAKRLKGKDALAEKRKEEAKRKVLNKAAEKERLLKEKQKVAEQRRILKAKFEEQRRLVKEKMVNAKSARKHNAVRLLREKAKQIDEDEKAAFAAMVGATPTRPKASQSAVVNPSPRAKRIQK